MRTQDIVISTRTYVCGIRKQNDIDIATYSLLDSQQCENKKKKITIMTLYRQICQKIKIKEIMVTQCKVELHRTVQRCSWWGSLKPAENGVEEYLIDISREQCKELHEIYC